MGSELRRQRRLEGFSHLPEPSTRPGGHAVEPASSLPHPRGWLCSQLHAWTWSERPQRGLLARKQTACRAAQRPTFPRGSWGARQVPVRTEEGWGKPPSTSRLLSQSGSCPARELDPEQRHLSGWGRKAGRGRDSRTKDQGAASGAVHLLGQDRERADGWGRSHGPRQTWTADRPARSSG